MGIRNLSIIVLFAALIFGFQHCTLNKTINQQEDTIALKESLIDGQLNTIDSLKGEKLSLTQNLFTTRDSAYQAGVESKHDLDVATRDKRRAQRAYFQEVKKANYMQRQCDSLLAQASLDAEIITINEPIYITVHDTIVKVDTKIVEVEVVKEVIKEVVPKDYVSIKEAVEISNKKINTPLRRLSFGPSATFGATRSMTDWDAAGVNYSGFNRAYNSFGKTEIGGALGVGLTYRLNKLKMKEKDFKK